MKDLSVAELFIILVNCELAKHDKTIGRLSVINEAIIAQVNVQLKIRPKEEIKEGLKTIVIIEPDLAETLKEMAKVFTEIAG